MNSLHVSKANLNENHREKNVDELRVVENPYCWIAKLIVSYECRIFTDYFSSESFLTEQRKPNEKVNQLCWLCLNLNFSFMFFVRNNLALPVLFYEDSDAMTKPGAARKFKKLEKTCHQLSLSLGISSI